MVKITMHFVKAQCIFLVFHLIQQKLGINLKGKDYFRTIYRMEYF